jgi:hypothetical protein
MRREKKAAAKEQQGSKNRKVQTDSQAYAQTQETVAEAVVEREDGGHRAKQD